MSRAEPKTGMAIEYEGLDRRKAVKISTRFRSILFSETAKKYSGCNTSIALLGFLLSREPAELTLWRGSVALWRGSVVKRTIPVQPR